MMNEEPNLDTSAAMEEEISPEQHAVVHGDSYICAFHNLEMHLVIFWISKIV